MGKRYPLRGAALGTGLCLGASLGMAGAHAADFTVTSTQDDGGGGETTLREALQSAQDNDNPGTVDRILFESGLSGTITLEVSQLPTIDEPLSILGPGAGTLAVSGGDSYRIFYPSAPTGTDVTIAGLTLTGGRSGNVPGGAIRKRFADLTIRDAVISDNATTGVGGTGAGIFSLMGSLTIESSTVSGNTTAAADTHGAGIYTREGSTTIERSTISGNTMAGDDGHGAGVHAYYGPLTVRDSTISGNHATGGGVPKGGGILSYGDALTIERSTISGNSVGGAGFGGGVFSFGGTVSITSTTITGNSSGYAGGGVTTSGSSPSPLLSNTIVANSTAPTDPDLRSSLDTFRLAFSLVEDPGGASLVQAVPGSNLLGVDPALGPLAANGAPTRTHALAATSPAVDKGSASGPDQRGRPRPVDVLTVSNGTAPGANGADIGAFELGYTPPRCAGRPATMLAGGGLARGTPGADVIVGSRKRDVIRGRGGRDVICGRGGRDKLIGGKGRDKLLGGKGRDILRGGPGRDKLKGGPGRDRQIQ